MPTISLEPLTAALSFSYGETSTKSLYFSVRLSGRPKQSLRLTTKENVNDLEGHLSLYRTEGNDLPYWKTVKLTDKQAFLNGEEARAIGALKYWKATYSDAQSFRSSYCFEAKISDENFGTLVAFLHQRILPKCFDVKVIGAGIEYGWEPDGSGIDWDNEQHNQVFISDISIKIDIEKPELGV